MPAGLSPADFYYILPEIVLALGAMIVLMSDVYLPRDSRAITGLSVGVLGATAVAMLVIGNPDVTISRGLLAIDAYGIFFKMLFLGAAAFTLLMSGPYLAVEKIPSGAYCFLVLAATLGMMFMASGVELVTIFIGLETMAIAFYILVGYLKPSERSNEAAVKYFLLGAFSLGILLYGMSLLYGLTGSTNLEAISTALAGGPASDSCCSVWCWWWPAWRSRLPRCRFTCGRQTCMRGLRHRSRRSCRSARRRHRSPCCFASSSGAFRR